MEDEKKNNEGTSGITALPSPSTEETNVTDRVVDEKVTGDNLEASGTSEVPIQNTSSENSSLGNPSKELGESGTTEIEKPSEWVEWRESSDSHKPTDSNLDSPELSTANVNSAELSNAAAKADPPNSVSESAKQNDAITESVAPSTSPDSSANKTDASANKTDASLSSTNQSIDVVQSNIKGLPEAENSDVSSRSCHPSSIGDETSSSTSNVDKPAETSGTTGEAEHEVET